MSLSDSHPEICERYHQHVASISLDQEKTLVPITESMAENGINSTDFHSADHGWISDKGQTEKDSSLNTAPVNGDELDALHFLTSYERYRRKFANPTSNLPVLVVLLKFLVDESRKLGRTWFDRWP